MRKKLKNQIKKGSVTPGLLVISSAFIVVIYAILFVLGIQLDFSHRQVASEQSLNIAEAGIDYYRWHLIINPNDYQDGTGAPGPYEHDYQDPQGDIIGKYSLEIIPPDANQIATIKSTGWTLQYPSVRRTIVVQLGKVSLSSYAFVTNSSLWFGDEVTVNGKVHSNGGIRQDGINTSNLYSAQSTYTCGVETGCPVPEEKPGIWGTGGDQSLWEFPVPPIDYDGLNVDFSTMKTQSQTSEGVYLPPGALGYHLVFSSDGSFNVYEVTAKNYIKGYSQEFGCENLYQTIVSETLIGTYQVADKEIVLAEADTWVDGTVNGVITVAAAQFPLDTYNTNIWLNENLIYLDKDGSHKLGLIAENEVVIGFDVPENFELNGAVVAKDGRAIRHHYGVDSCFKAIGQDRIKTHFEFYGSLVSNNRSYWNYGSGPGMSASGFESVTLTFDPNMGDDPAPYFPNSGYQFVSWREE